MIDIYVLNHDREIIVVIDNYTSLIWTTKYFGVGDFELYLPADKNLLDYLKCDYILMREDDPTAMLIDTIHIKTNAETGDYFIIKGKALDSIASRRVFATQMKLNGTVAECIHKAVYTALYQSDTDDIGYRRKVQGFKMGEFYETPETLTTQVTGDNLAEWLEKICTSYGYGWRIVLNENFEMVFELYNGNISDVIFSADYDNLLSSEYVKTCTNFKNYAYVFGEGEGSNRARVMYTTDLTARGLNLFEIYVDARDLSKSTDEGQLTIEEYNALLTQRGKEKLKEYGATQAFSGEIEPTVTYVYKQDYNLGDIVTVEDSYGLVAQPRIIEITESWDENGYTVIPTFTEWEV